MSLASRLCPSLLRSVLPFFLSPRNQTPRVFLFFVRERAALPLQWGFEAKKQIKSASKVRELASFFCEEHFF